MRLCLETGGNSLAAISEHVNSGLIRQRGKDAGRGLLANHERMRKKCLSSLLDAGGSIS
jgi:hypothetical protein